MRKSLAFALAVSLLGAQAHAAVVVDESPDAVGFTNDFNASNQIGGQNFFTRFTLGSATTLTGMDIYSSFGALVGAGVVVRFRAEVAGAPDVTNIASITTTLSAVDGVGASSFPTLQRLHADFAGVTLAAGSYYASLAGVNEIGWSLDSTQPDATYQFVGEQQQFFRNWYAPFRLSDDGAVPEPATWAMMIVGMGIVGGTMRAGRRRTALAFRTA